MYYYNNNKNNNSNIKQLVRKNYLLFEFFIFCLTFFSFYCLDGKFPEMKWHILTQLKNIFIPLEI